MILQEGIIALIQFLLKLFSALLRNLFADFIQKAELRVEHTPPVVPFSVSENHADGIVSAAGNDQAVVDAGRKPGALQIKAGLIGSLFLCEKAVGGGFQTAFVFGKPGGDSFLAVRAFRQPGLDVI